jgi:hypothetical protein
LSRHPSLQLNSQLHDLLSFDLNSTDAADAPLIR